MCIPLSLLGSSLVKVLLLQQIQRSKRRIVEGIVFYAVCVTSKESRRLVLPRTCCFMLCWNSLFSMASDNLLLCWHSTFLDISSPFTLCSDEIYPMFIRESIKIFWKIVQM
jgi:hypothetical protein